MQIKAISEYSGNSIKPPSANSVFVVEEFWQQL